MRAAFEYVAFGVTDKHSVFDLDLDLGRGLLAVDDRDEAISYLDPEFGCYYADVVADVTLQSRRLLGVCRDRGWIRNDIPFDDIVETTGVLPSRETYHQIVRHDGMSTDAYQRWVRRMLDETVLQHG